ncbi:MAG TPA: alpha/beta hydrolase [Thermoanaerobaculia bacterium]|nr:alpha/beta hydrolase [Thermoanaerobaculia bacterium]
MPVNDPQSIIRRNNVKIMGTGDRTLLFAHGFGCDQNMWRFIVPAFEHDYRIVLFDYVGAGNSDVSQWDERRYATLEGYSRDILEICEALDLRQVILVGHSVSSVIGILAAIEQPDRFERLILVGPSPRYINDTDYVGGFERADIEGLLDMMDKNFIGWANALAPVIMKNPDKPELAAELEESFCSTDPRIARLFAQATFFSDNRDDLEKVRIPSLIMQCSEDAIAPVEVGDFLHARLAGSTLRRLQATGHCPHVSHPEETIRVMREYLEN